MKPARKTKTCRMCPEKFVPMTTTQVVCSYQCGLRKANADRAKRHMAGMRPMSSKMNRKRTPEQLAQDAVNAFIRARDHNKPCIVTGKVGTRKDAGHFQSVGSCPELRFNTWNIHGQDAVNNRGGHKRARYNGEGTAALYEQNLRERIGDERVDWLKGPHKPKQYREDDFKRITRIFNRRARHYRKLRGIE